MRPLLPHADAHDAHALMKTLFKLLLLLALIVYLGFAFTRISNGATSERCQGVEFTITDTTHAGFITAAEAERLLKAGKAYPTGTLMDSISLKRIESVLLKNPFIKGVTAYKTAGNQLCVIIEQRLPLMRVMAESGEDYYVDENGYPMNANGYVADHIIATGHIDKNFTKQHLVDMGLFLKNNTFWNDQIEQINVTEDHKLELVPRVGDQIIHFGKPDSISKKFRNLMVFYQKVMPKVGWNKYKAIDISLRNQIVCKKRDEEKGNA